MDLTVKKLEKEAKAKKSKGYDREGKPNRHIFRKVLFGLGILGAVGATEELTRVGAGHNWDLGKAYGVKEKVAQATYAGVVVKVGDNYYEFKDGKLDTEALYVEESQIIEKNGEKLINIWTDESGLKEYDIVNHSVITRGFNGGYYREGNAISTEDFKNIKNNDMSEINGEKFYTIVAYAVQEDEQGIYNMNGGKKNYLGDLRTENGKYYATINGGKYEVVADGDRKIDFGKYVKQAEQDPAPETPADPTPENPEDENQTDPETPGDQQDQDETNVIEGQDKGTFTDKDAANVIDAELDIMIRMEMPELININMQSIEMSNGYIIFKALNKITNEEGFYTVNLRKTGKETSLKALGEIITKAKLGKHTKDKEIVERELREVIQSVTGTNIKKAKELKTPSVEGTTLLLYDNWKVDFENNSASLVDVLVTVLLNNGGEMTFQVEMPEDQYKDIDNILDQEIIKVLQGQTSELINSDSCEYFKVLTEMELKKEQTDSLSNSDDASVDLGL